MTLLLSRWIYLTFLFIFIIQQFIIVSCNQYNLEATDVNGERDTTIKLTTNTSQETQNDDKFIGKYLASATADKGLSLQAAESKEVAINKDLQEIMLMTNQVETPVFQPSNENFVLFVDMKILCGTSGALIYYTTDGTVPTKSSLSLNSDESLFFSELGSFTIQAIGVKDGYLDSDVAVKKFNILDRVSKPFFSPSPSVGQIFMNKVVVTLYCLTPNATIYYTIDQSTPSHSSPKIFSGSKITISTFGVTVLRAFASKEGFGDSAIFEQSYSVIESAFEIYHVYNEKEFLVQPKLTTQIVKDTITSCDNCTRRYIHGRLLTIENPINHMSFLPPLKGCDQGTSLASATGGGFIPKRTTVTISNETEYLKKVNENQKYEDEYELVMGLGCQVITNAGTHSTTDGTCIGNIVSQGEKIREVSTNILSFGILQNQSYFVGYIEDPNDYLFQELISGDVWLVRNGENYVSTSLAYKNNIYESIATSISSRTAIGFDQTGRMKLLQIEGKEFQEGMTLNEFSDLLLELGFHTAINLGGENNQSTIMLQNQSIVIDPVSRCNSESNPLFRCEVPISSILCIHAEPPLLFDFNGASKNDDHDANLDNNYSNKNNNCTCIVANYSNGDFNISFMTYKQLKLELKGTEQRVKTYSVLIVILFVLLIVSALVNVWYCFSRNGHESKMHLQFDDDPLSSQKAYDHQISSQQQVSHIGLSEDRLQPSSDENFWARRRNFVGTNVNDKGGSGRSYNKLKQVELELNPFLARAIQSDQNIGDKNTQQQQKHLKNYEIEHEDKFFA